MDKERVEKVKKGLECCTRSHQTIRQNMCDECPYKNKGVMNAFTVWKTCTNALAEDALKLINELQAATEPKWIPVSERLPETIDFVLCTDGGCVDIGFCNGRGCWHCDPLDNYVTHWMPLPEPPKDS